MARLPLRQADDAGDAVAEGRLLGCREGAVVVSLAEEADGQHEPEGGEGEVDPEGCRPGLGCCFEGGEEGA